MRSNTSANLEANHERRLRRAAFIASLVIYAVLVGVNFDPEVTKAQVGVAGERPFGMPTREFFMGLNAVLFFPIFWWTPSLMKLLDYAQQKDTSVALTILSALFTPIELVSAFASVNDDTPKEIKRARLIAFLGFVYFVALIATWIVLAARAGV